MRYPNASAFRTALEQRLNARADGDGARIARDRKRVAFDRFLARLAQTSPSNWLLKGGFALDLRLADRARTTRDIDLDWQAAEDALLEALITAASAVDYDDYFTFAVERTGPPPDRLGGSHRFRIVASLAGREFDTFLLDAGIRAEPFLETETLRTSDLLAFADIDPVAVPAVPLEYQVAEKLHAYTRRYGDSPSTRVKDLVDLALIAEFFPLPAPRLHDAITTTFETRADHEAPARLPRPPADWEVPYRALAAALGIAPDLNAGHAAAAALLDPVLGGSVTDGSWDPEAGRWHEPLDVLSQDAGPSVGP